MTSAVQLHSESAQLSQDSQDDGLQFKVSHNGLTHGSKA